MKKILMLAVVFGGLAGVSTLRAHERVVISVGGGYGYSGGYSTPSCETPVYSQPSYGYGYGESYNYAPSYSYGRSDSFHHELRDEHRAVHHELRDEHRAAHHELRDAHEESHYNSRRW